jgi:thiamine pyrophosphate-dependent acetolactate synthase large subunit-like protein
VTEEVVRSEHMRDHLQGRESEVILPQMAIEMLYELTKGEAIITTGVGQHQMWAGQYYKFTKPAPVPHQRRPGRDGLRLSGRPRRQGRLPGQAGG